MRTTITVDDALVEQAVELSRVHEKAALIRTALQTLLRVASARRLNALGGRDPQAAVSPRRRQSER